MLQKDLEKIYSGWLGKNIGIRLGAPIEGWTSQQIIDTFGEFSRYLPGEGEFAADDDANGPLFFIRALEDKPEKEPLQASHVGEALLNYAPFEHGFFWWGGYGISTEHTAYLNLRNGIPAPRSGSIAQNGRTVAEQIGGQIFIDCWGLVNPGNPDRAAAMAKEAASVTHDGEGILGGIFLAACVAQAFREDSVEKVLEKGLSYLPEDSQYRKTVEAVWEFYKKEPNDWKACRDYVQAHFGYHLYPGACHIIPNCAVVALGLLYGQGDFEKSIVITNLCGWDTDCNVGNVGCILGVLVGEQGIADHWKEPIHDLLISSSVLGSLNITDIPYGAAYMGALACRLNGEEPPAAFAPVFQNRLHSCHFEYPGSTHSIRIQGPKTMSSRLWNTDETAFSGNRCLQFAACSIGGGDTLQLFQKTYYEPADFRDSRYDPAFSPLVYPGMKLHAALRWKNFQEKDVQLRARLFAVDLHTGEKITGESQLLSGEWQQLSWVLPAGDGLISRIGVELDVVSGRRDTFALSGYLDDLYWEGEPSYILDFSKEKEEVWTAVHREISQFTRYKGLLYLEEGMLHLSCGDEGAAYTGRYDWKDYSAAFTITPITGEHHLVNIRVQGAQRCYAAGSLPNGRFAILKKNGSYVVLAETSFRWEAGKTYTITLECKGETITASVDDVSLSVKDPAGWIKGCLGISVIEGSHMACSKIIVEK